LNWHEVSKAFGPVQAVDRVTLQLKRGEVLGLLGPNGAGKSTLLALATGLEMPDSGEIIAAGNIGFMPQEYALYPTLSAWDNVMYLAGLWRLSRSVARKEAARVIELVGLGQQRDMQVKTFSGGMRRRLSLGIALLGSPPVLLLDEPTVGVDPQSRLGLLKLVKDASASGVAVIYSSHYMEEVQTLVDRVAILDRGRLVCEGRVGDLIAQHGTTTLELEVIAAEPDRLLNQLDPCEAFQSRGYRVAESGVISLSFNVINREDAVADVLQASRSAGASVVDLRLREPTLEAVFMSLTGRQLCD
jgi:ABC-2 type transport system ATP-binding protein